MYIFEAHFINMRNNKETVRIIGFNEVSYSNEKECYLYAMNKAYGMTEKNELLSLVEFIGC